MRIHTNELLRAVIYTAANNAGACADVEEHTSRTHERSYELRMVGGSIASKRRPNNGGYSDEYAATWDQWGAVMGAIFAADPDTRMGGSVKRPTYANAEDFHYQTDERFTDAAGHLPEDAHGDHKWIVGQPYVQTCKVCSAVKRWEPVQY